LWQAEYSTIFVGIDPTRRLTMSACIQNDLTHYHAKQPRGGVWETIQRMARQWQRRSEERRSYALMSDRDMLDVGLSRFEIENELARRFWRD
jgi:uncharacterized protein YjiS (DUF1127 family)